MQIANCRAMCRIKIEDETFHFHNCGVHAYARDHETVFSKEGPFALAYIKGL